MNQNQIETPVPNKVKPVHELFKREVNRSEFLSIVGFGMLAMIGLGPIIHFLTGKGHSTKVVVQNQKTASSGFGTGPYGV